MPALRFDPLPQSLVDSLRAGGPDANGQPDERAVSSGTDTPCRSGPNDVPKGAAMRVFAARPLGALYPRAGP
jgi:hypothetical protein